MSLRRLRFALLETVLLPLALPLARLWMRTWRTAEPSAELLAQLALRPRLVVLTYHGLLAQTLAFAPLAPRHGRRFVVMLSPSLDGRLLAAALARFGVGHVFATSGSRGVAGSRELARRVAAGDIAIIAVDGPRGPRGVAKPGALRLAEAIGADLLLSVPVADRGFSLPSWDGAFVPRPGATVTLHLAHVARGAGADAAARLSALAKRVRSPVLPAAQSAGE